MLRKILFSAALLLACGVSVFGQGFSIGADLPINTALYNPGPISTISGTLISICAHPANAVPCTNKVTTYTDITTATACPTSTQLVLSGTNSCVANTDPYGNWRAWVGPGTYDFTVQFPTGQAYGPFTISTAAGGSGSILPTNNVFTGTNNFTGGLFVNLNPVAATFGSFTVNDCVNVILASPVLFGDAGAPCGSGGGGGGAPLGGVGDVQIKASSSTFGSGVLNAANVGVAGNIAVKPNVTLSSSAVNDSIQ